MTSERRRSFGEDAELYDRARPGYPEALYDDLLRVTGLGKGDRVLEVGCGTGQATVPLARRGFRLTAVELSRSLARVARRNLRPFPNARVRVGEFERLRRPRVPFDLVLAATAFHWIDPAVRVRKAAEMLRPGGYLAVVHTHHVLGGSRKFFAESQRCYRRFFPRSSAGYRLPRPHEVVRVGSGPGSSLWFSPLASLSYRWQRTYSTENYLDLLRTYSDHRSLGTRRREELLRCLGSLIDRRFGGRVRKAHLTELTLVTRNDRPVRPTDGTFAATTRSGIPRRAR